MPKKYNVIYSSEIQNQKEYKSNLNRINTFVTYLKNGDLKINSPSENFLPRSYKTYFTSKFGQSQEYRYSPDAVNGFFGIRHAHLKNAKCNELIFYIIEGENAYLLKIGTHNDFYNKDNLEIIINEFEHLIDPLGIISLNGLLHPGIQSSEEEIKKAWCHGINAGFIINGILYIGSPMTHSRINNNLITILQNLHYQIKSGLQLIENLQKERHIKFSLQRMVILKKETELDKGNGIIHLKNTHDSFSAKLTVQYLQKLYITEKMLSL